MRRVFTGSCFVLFLLAELVLSAQQGIRTVDTYYPVTAKSYGIDEGLPDRCVQTAYVDSAGRMHLLACPDVQEAQGLGFYQFDGYRAYTGINTTGADSIRAMIICGETEDELFGYEYYRDPTGAYERFHLIQIEKSGNKVHKVDPGYDGPGELQIFNVYYHDHSHYVFGSADSNFVVMVLKDGKTSIIDKIPGKIGFNVARFTIPFLVTDQSYWFFSSPDTLAQVSLKNHTVQKVNIPGRQVLGNILNGNLVENHDGNILFGSPSQKRVWSIDKKTMRLGQPHSFDRADGVYLFGDNAGNILFVTEETSETYKGYLLDPQGSYHDYSAVLDLSLPASVNFARNFKLSSTDFTSSLMTLGGDFSIIEVASRSAIQTLPTERMRSMVEYAPGYLFIAKDRYAHVKGQPEIFDEVPSECLKSSAVRCDIVTNDDYIWVSSGDSIRQYHIASKECQVLSVGRIVSYFTYTGEDRFVLLDNNNKLFSYQVSTGSTEDILDDALAGFINQLIDDEKGRLWVATNSGLILVNVQNRSAEHIPELNGVRILTILPRPTGELWLGTFGAGVYIYDPESGAVEIVDEGKGLSNNTVATMIEDADGDIWLGTYNGITIVTDSLKVIGQIYDRDGLINDECNRWSVTSLSDGRLCFGSTVGLSIIDPELIKERIRSRERPRIYLTRIQYQDSVITIDDNALSNLSNTGIILPAHNRNLTVSFAQSSYTTPNESTYAYQLEGQGDEWNYIGTLHELPLFNLPSGSYRILIRGVDFRGQSTSNTIAIPVMVREYFYYKWWFYVLCAIPFVVFGTLWAYRQRSEKKRLETEVARRTETISQQADELREIDRVKSRLYTNITHEFRTPLTVIRGMVENVEEDPKAKELIRRNTDNLLDLVNQMLDLRKLESGNLKLNLVQSDLIRFLQYVGESFRSLASLKFQQFHFLSEQDSLLMDFDTDMLARVVSNLLSNAIKFTPEGGDIYLIADLSEDGDNVQIKVRDTGIGIPEEAREKIFERFYQVDDSSTRRGEGTGIGLTLVHEIVKLMKGNIALRSRPGHGSTFTVTLPVRNDAPLADVEKHQIPELALASGTGDRNTIEPVDEHRYANLPRVLIVEDNPDVVHYLGTCLHENYQVSVAMDGQEGIEKAFQNVPDLIISDVMMPLKDGFELCQTLKQDNRTSHIPIILLTARADAESRLKGLSRGADAYLEKPFSKEELEVRMEKLIELRETLRSRYAAASSLSPTDDPDLQIEDAFIQEFTDTLNAHLDDADFGIAEMCDALHIGRTQLHNKITALTGMSTSHYIRRLRLQAAEKLLKDPKHNISEVAYAVGFKDPKYFTKVFKEVHGVTPSEWVKE